MKIKLSQLRSIIREEVAKTYSQYNKEGWPKCEKPGCRGRMKPALSGRKTSLFCGICGAEKKRGLKLETIIREEVENAMNTTTFECRLCGDTIQGEASPEGPGKAGWSSLAGIDGPNAVCPECVERVRQDPSEPDDFREEYPNVRLAESSSDQISESEETITFYRDGNGVSKFRNNLTGRKGRAYDSAPFGETLPVEEAGKYIRKEDFYGKGRGTNVPAKGFKPQTGK